MSQFKVIRKDETTGDEYELLRKEMHDALDKTIDGGGVCGAILVFVSQHEGREFYQFTPVGLTCSEALVGLELCRDEIKRDMVE